MATRWRRWTRAGGWALLAALAGIGGPARADEGGGGHYQPGYAGYTFGMLPTERGLYFSNFQRFYTGTRRGDQPLEIGGRVQFGVENFAFLELPSFMYLTGRKLLGADLGIALATPVSYTDVTKVSVLGPLVGVQEKTNFNLGDVYFAPVVLGWRHGNLHYAAYLGLFAPTGDWSVGELAPTGKNFWTFEPGLGFTYLDPKSGWEVSSYTAVDFNRVNETIDYDSGDDFHIDITLAKHLLRAQPGPRPPDAGPTGAADAGDPAVTDIAVGMAFAWYQQLTGDTGADNEVGSFKGRMFGLGPSLRAVVPVARKPVTFQLRLLREFGVVNRPEGMATWFITSLKL